MGSTKSPCGYPRHCCHQPRSGAGSGQGGSFVRISIFAFPPFPSCSRRSGSALATSPCWSTISCAASLRSGPRNRCGGPAHSPGLSLAGQHPRAAECAAPCIGAFRAGSTAAGGPARHLVVPGLAPKICPPENDTLVAYEQSAVENALQKTGNNKRQAALLLGDGKPPSIVSSNSSVFQLD